MAISAAATLVFVLIVAYLYLAAPIGNARLQPNSPDWYFHTVKINITDNGVSTAYGAYLAANLTQQEQGYMNQTGIGDCNGIKPCIGMLFVFQNSSSQCFWMKNTEIPLKQVWINNGAITRIYNATPYSTDVICGYGNWVLETGINQSIPAGSRITFANGTS